MTCLGLHSTRRLTVDGNLQVLLAVVAKFLQLPDKRPLQKFLRAKPEVTSVAFLSWLANKESLATGEEKQVGTQAAVRQPWGLGPIRSCCIPHPQAVDGLSACRMRVLAVCNGNQLDPTRLVADASACCMHACRIGMQQPMLPSA